MKKRRAAKNASPLLSVLIVVFCLLVFFGILYLESQPAHAPAESAGLSAADGSFDVHFLDIGQGYSALLFCGEETTYSYTHLRAHFTDSLLVFRLFLQ